jgi:hypothetical protein
MTVEYVDILAPPKFEPTGRIKPVQRAIEDGDWLGVMNLWLVRPGHALVYQERPENGWAPGKLDGSVGGYYRAGERGLDGLREAQEELGRTYSQDNITLLGRRLSVGVDHLGRERRVVATIYMTWDTTPLSSFVLDPREVPAVFEIPTKETIAVLSGRQSNTVARGINARGETVERVVRADDYSDIFYNYHINIARLADQFSNGRRELVLLG